MDDGRIIELGTHDELVRPGRPVRSAVALLAPVTRPGHFTAPAVRPDWIWRWKRCRRSAPGGSP